MLFSITSVFLLAMENTAFAFFDNFHFDFVQTRDTLENTYSNPVPQDTSRERTNGGNSDFIQTQITYNAADSIVMSRTDNKIYLYKNATVNYGEIELKADYIEYSQDSNYVYARGLKDSTGKVVGKPVFKEGDQSYDAEMIRYNFKTREGYIKKVVTKEQEGFLHSETTKKHSNDHFHFKDGKYTTCDKAHPDFYINISKGMVVPNERIVAGPSYLVIEDIPLPLVLPFGYFPIQKKQSSGILMPRYGEEGGRGFYLRDIGYYFGISEHMDLKVMGSIYSRGSWGVNLDYRLMERYKYTSNFSLDFKRLVKGDKGSPDYVASRDYSIIWNHRQDPKASPYSSFNANVNYSSTSYDRLHSRNIEDRVSNTKSSSISYQKTWPGSPFSFNGKLRHSQNSSTNMVNLILPEMSLSMSRQYPFRQFNNTGRSKWYDDIQVSYNANMKNQIQSPDSTLFDNMQYSDFESGFQHRIPLSLNFKVLQYLNITPNVNYTGVLYPRYVERYWDETQQRVVEDTVEDFRYAQSVEPNLSMSISPKIFGMFQFKNPDAKVQAIRHVMTPSVNFNFRPDLGDMTSRYYDTYQVDTTGRVREYSYFDGQLYRPPSPPRRSGTVGFGLSNNLEMKVKSKSDTTEQLKKVSLLKQLSFNSGYNIFADSLKWSSININGRTSLFNNKVSLNFGGNFDPYAINDDGQRIDEFQWSKNGELGRLTRFNASVNMNLGPGGGSQSSRKGNNQQGQTQAPGVVENPYSYFHVPWSLQVGYNFNYTKPGFESNITQTVSVSGNFSLTDKWQFNFSTFYDIKEDKISTAQLSVTRNLHCWSMTFDWTPVGRFASYFFEIHVNSNILQDLKLTKQNSWYDNL
jgi:lipopolysaccharide assembly outer membrane protein LptD (OstA)